MLASSSNRALISTRTTTCLPGLGRLDQRGDDGGVAGRPVQGLLDRQHLRIGGGLLDEPLHAGRERVVGVLDQDVALAQGGEHALGRLAVRQPGMGGRDERVVLELRPVEVVEPHQRGEVEQPGHVQHVLGLHLHLRQQHLEDLRVHRLGDLEADRRPEPPAGQLALQRLQQVLVAVLLDLDVGVAGHPEQVVGHDVQAREELREVGGDEVLERQEGRRPVGRPDGHEPGHVVRDLHPGEVGQAGVGIAHHHGQVERQAADVREGVRRVDRQRREHGEDLVAEVLPQAPRVLVGQVLPVHDPDALGLEPGRDVLDEDVGVPLDEVLRPLPDELELLADRQPVGGADGESGLLPALEPGDAHHVELVEVAGEDRQELDALEQRQRLVLRELQHACVEVQPGQLSVQESVARQGGGPGRTRRGHGLIVPHAGCTTGRPIRPPGVDPTRAVVRGPAPSASAARRSASVSTSRTSPGHGPVSGTAPLPRCASRGPRTELRPQVGADGREQRRPGALRVSDERAPVPRRPAGRRPVRRGAGRAGRRTGRRRRGRRRCARRARAPGSAPGRAGRQPSARPASRTTSAAAGSSVTTTTSPTAGQASGGGDGVGEQGQHQVAVGRARAGR